MIFVGCILGQFTMGYAGDLLGRSRALSLTLGLAVVGALGSSVAALVRGVEREVSGGDE